MKKLIITLVISIFSIFSVNAEEQLLTENEFKKYIFDVDNSLKELVNKALSFYLDYF